MTTKYFILTKEKESPLWENDKNQLVFLNRDLSFILPQVNLDYYSRKGLFESGLIEWSKQLCSKNTLFLDIGAHTGTYALSLADYSKHVYAFEPQKMTFYALCGSVALSSKHNITCLPLGLGSPQQVGISTLKIRSEDGGGSSLLDIEGANILAEEEIRVTTLDTFFNDNLITTPVGFIKMDVEYNELNVLHGGIKTLRKYRPKILFEVNTDSPLAKDVFAFLENELQYKIIQVTGADNMFLGEAPF